MEEYQGTTRNYERVKYLIRQYPYGESDAKKKKTSHFQCYCDSKEEKESKLPSQKIAH
jgi:hypothetical protein